MKRVLVAPLCWGLGHATRCIPLIHQLLEQKVEIVIASDGDALELLKIHFPQLPFEIIAAYNIQYSSENMVWNMATQVPKILKAIRREHQQMQSILKKHQIDTIISDNRFGVYHPSVHNIFMTHQLEVIIPFPPLSYIFKKLYHRHLQLNFQEIWIPDHEGFPKLSGQLSYPTTLSEIPIRYIGTLSIMKKLEIPIRFKYCFLLSGPEPMRSIFEQKIRLNLSKTNAPIALVLGKMQEKSKDEELPNCSIFPFLTGDELCTVLNASEVIICRSGYSSIMDLATLNKKAVFVPTPGQTEQEYLAHYLSQQGLSFFIKQDNFDLIEIEKNIVNKQLLKINEHRNPEIS